MIGGWILAFAIPALLVGIFVVVFVDWMHHSEPDAPRGGPIVAVALVALICGGVVSCAETAIQVQEMKRAEGRR